MNEYRNSPRPGWNDISTAPRDGTPIKIQFNYFNIPREYICHWEDGYAWVVVSGTVGIDTLGHGPHLCWQQLNDDEQTYWRTHVGKKITRRSNKRNDYR